MIIPKSNIKNRKKIALAVVTLALLAATVFYVFYNFGVGNVPSVKNQEIEKKLDAENKQEFLDTVEPSDKKENSNTNTPAFTQPSDDITVEISEDADNVIIKTNLLNLSSGTCSISITGGSTSITKEADIIYSNSFSTCAGFTINKSELRAKEWSIKLTVSSTNGQVTKEEVYTVK